MRPPRRARKSHWVIRPVRKSDRREWLRMRRALWPNGADDHPREIDSYLRKPRRRWPVFVAQVEGRAGLAGFLEASLRDRAEGCASTPVAYVEAWYVDPAFRRRGLGAALIRRAESWARRLMLSEIASDAELVSPASHRAHAALGFEETGRIVCFRKSLNTS
jgi:aminoglycoside 6'-N-acetyltransferase I